MAEADGQPVRWGLEIPMQAAHPTSKVESSLAGGQSAAIVVFTAIDGALCDGTGAWREATDALALLASRDIPVVLVSARCAADVIALQERLGLRQPFICRSGAELHVPRGYFPDLQDLWPSDEVWHVIGLGAPEPGRAVRVLVSLFQTSGRDILTVGLGSTWADRLFLTDVDVPIIVGGHAPDEQRLHRVLPGAYVTTAAGPAGWSEAILGSVSG